MTSKRSSPTRRRYRRPSSGPSLWRRFTPRVELLEERNLLDAAGTSVLDLGGLQVNTNRYDADHILVRFRPEALASTEMAGLMPGTELGSAMGLVSGLYEVTLDAGVNIDDALAAYRANPLVLYAEPDYE